MKNRIILIYGPSGSGKSTMIRHLLAKSSKVALLKKYSTRKIREYEKHCLFLLDNHLVSRKEFESLGVDSVHTRYGVSYGVCFEDIDNILSEGRYPVFASPSSIFKKVKEHYADETISVLVKSSIADCGKRLDIQQMSDEQRLLRVQYWKDYHTYEEELNFDVVIHNMGTLSDFLEEIDHKMESIFL